MYVIADDGVTALLDRVRQVPGASGCILTSKLCHLSVADTHQPDHSCLHSAVLANIR